MKNIVFAGGGSAGHIMPNLALIENLKNDFNIYYIGSKNGIECSILKNYNYIKFYNVECTKLIRKLTLKNLLIPFKLIKSIKNCKKILKHINPSLVFCKGGFVSLPVAIASKQLKIPVISHESDITMGLSNKIILKFATKMCFSFKSCVPQKDNCIYTGTPIRNEILIGNKNNINCINARFNNNLKNVLVIGGSLGSKTINKIIFKNINNLSKQYNIIHITGKGNTKQININNYVQKEFVYDIQNYLNWCDIAISRAGSNTIFELLSLQKLMLLIPLSKQESRGDQILNAENFKNNGYAELIYEENLNYTNLINTLNKLKNNEKYYIHNMINSENNGTRNILKIIKKYAK